MGHDESDQLPEEAPSGQAEDDDGAGDMDQGDENPGTPGDDDQATGNPDAAGSSDPEESED